MAFLVVKFRPHWCSVALVHWLAGFKSCYYLIFILLLFTSLKGIYTQVFIHHPPACRLALSSPCSSNYLSVSSSMNQCPIPSSFPTSPSQSSLSQPTKLSGGIPASPSHGKARSNKRKSMFGGSVRSRSDSMCACYRRPCTHSH